MDLARKRCKPCEGGVKPMSKKEAAKYLRFAEGWRMLTDGSSIRRDFKLRDFDKAMKFVVKVGKVAQKEDHHPDIYLHEWNKVRLTLSTHAIKGLSVNDFIVASKINKVF